MKTDYYQEEYEEIPGFSSYGVTAGGQVINLSKGGLPITHYSNRAGHSFISMKNDDGFYVTRHLGKIVLKAYVQPKEPHWDTVIYLDGDKSNCRLDNLAWRPRWFAVKYNREKSQPLVDGNYPVKDEDTGEIYPTVREASAASGVLEEEIIRKLGTPNRVYPTHQLFGFA